MKSLFRVVTCFGLAGCVTLSGTYNVVARDPMTGQDFPGPRLIAQGSGIYTLRNALCVNHPKAIVIITDTRTGEELKSESSYTCP